MAGPINNHSGLGLNGSKTGALSTGAERKESDNASDQTGPSSQSPTDEVSLSAAAKQLNAQENAGVRKGHIETPEQAAMMAKQVAAQIRQDGATALSAQGSGDVSGLRGLLMTA